MAFMLMLDLYFFQAVKLLTHASSPRLKTIIYSGYWLISITAIIILMVMRYVHFDKQARMIRTSVFALISGLIFAKLIASVFFLIDDARRVIQWIVGKLMFSKTEGEDIQSGEAISRSMFLTWAGMIAGGGLFSTLVYGFGNKYNYQVKRIRLSYNNLPPAFNGLRIVHISDIHCGSFNNKAGVMKGVKKIMAEKPDIILFTGDLVNNVSDEMENYMDVFSQLKAPMGVYATLGNHDYGDYVSWDTPDKKLANLEQLKQIYVSLGWRLLMNEHIPLERGNDKIALIGVENWSAKARFPKYGHLLKAYEGASEFPFKILMSHDPSHWKAEVIPTYPDIDLVLSGHTHGMQFGVEIAGFKWSPVQYIYKEWAGLYENEAQKLYVNRGFGFIGYPGRVGILPEITVLELIS